MTCCLYSPGVGKLGAAGEVFRIPAFLNDLSIEPGKGGKVGAGGARSFKEEKLAEMFSILASRSILTLVRPAGSAPHPPWAR